MHSIDTLPKTKFSGRKFTRKQLLQVKETVESFQNLSRKELALTICEHFDWKAANGSLKIQSGLKLLEDLESYGVITLPAKKERKQAVQREPTFDTPADTRPINGSLEFIGPITLKLVTSKEDRELWKAYIHHYHYLGYKHPVGFHLGYFIVSERLQQILGCLLFSASAAWALAPRDQFIGWEKKHREKLLNLIISNDRLLIFPWINVANLASKAMSLVTKRIGKDWLDKFGYRPVMIETFVDTTKYTGTCYQAANFQHIGKTKGRSRFVRNENSNTIKDIYIYPLESNWRHTLTNCHPTKSLKKKYRNDLPSSHTHVLDDSFVQLWQKVVTIIKDVSSKYDEMWQIRKRVLDSMLLIILIFRLVCSKNSKGYGTTIDELWDNCNRLDIPLPQKGSIAPSTFCDARKKLDETAFKDINYEIIETYAKHYQLESYRWKGKRIFAVDGSKINLPCELMADGYERPSEKSHYPQGLLSCLYQLKSQMPFDFDLVSHANERSCALQHLNVLEEDDVVVYDRGYLSYVLLHRHLERKIHAVFRLQSTSFSVIRDFFASNETDIIARIYPSRSIKCEIKLKYPDLEIIPLQLRLIKYWIDDTMYCLGTTLIDRNQFGNLQDFIDIYHARWGVEVLYDISKHIFEIEDFRSKSERGVKQEIFAHFALITMNRIFANQADNDLNQSDNRMSSSDDRSDSNGDWAKCKVNFKNCVHVLSRSLEELTLLQSKMNSVVERVYQFVIGRHQKQRPERSYERKSMKPISKWQKNSRSLNQSTATG